MRTTLGTFGALLLMTTTAACGGSDTDARPAEERTDVEGGVYNTHDVEFATAMIPHHAQALTLVDLTAAKDVTPRVRRLAEDVLATQGPQVETMTGWLTLWHEPVPETMRDHVNVPHSHSEEEDATASVPRVPESHADMPGMLDTERFEQIAAADGTQFETLWLEAMVEHHEGAIDMAEDELDRGVYEPARTLAQDVLEGQQEEIEVMEELLRE